MNYRELTRKLKRMGCKFERQGIGSHELWINTTNNATTSIPNWRAKDLRPGTIAAILRDLGVSRRAFDQA